MRWLCSPCSWPQCHNKINCDFLMFQSTSCYNLITNNKGEEKGKRRPCQSKWSLWENSLKQWSLLKTVKMLSSAWFDSSASGGCTAGCTVGFATGAFRFSLPEDVALQLITLLLLILSLKPHGLLFLLRLLTQTIHQPLISQGFLLSVKHTITQELQF